MPTSTRGRDPAREEEFLGALYKGGELLAAGNVVEAREHLEKAHGLEPKNEKAQNLLGLTYFKLGLYDQASEVYEKLVNENPADATLRVNLGLVYLKTNALERCIHEFETATDLEPTHQKAHNYLGLALAQQGSYAKAREHFELAGSVQMAEKMARAIAAQSTPSGSHGAVARQAPKTVVLGSEDAKPAPPVAEAAPPPPAPADDTIEVMSDEELPSDVYVVPEDVAAAAPPPEAANLNGDWGAQFDGGAPAPVEEMRFAEDEGPSSAEELPVLEGEVEVVSATSEPVPAPMPSTPTPAWLTMEAAEGARVDTQTHWVTESVADVPPPESESVPVDVVEDIAAGVSSEEVPAAPMWEGSYAETSSGEHPPVAAIVEPLPNPRDAWATATVEVAPIPTVVEPLPATPDDSSWATAPVAEAQAV
ncbi:MAG: tetratricopeptide repeat protein, partial [Archangium sp.]